MPESEGAVLKLEVIQNPNENQDDGNDSVNEIQNYLESFNKEIAGGGGETNTVVVTEALDGTEYYVDQSGQYYFQNSDGTSQLVTVVQSVDPHMGTIDEVNEDDDEFIHGEEEGNDEQMETNSHVVARSTEEGIEQMIDLNSGEYQTVTIVPSEGSSGEVSYVLIVQQDEDGKKKKITIPKTTRTNKKIMTVKKEPNQEEDQDLTVYDFEESEDVDPIAGPTRLVQLKNENESFNERPKPLKQNRKQVVAPAHMCNYCNYMSTKRYLLARHMKSHSEERPHKCSVCERGFKTVASLTNHVNTHTGVKPHKCKFCESRFTTSGELVRHVRYKHTHEKPHKCTICDYASVELSKMRNHMRSHTGERPYQCPHCTYASPDTFKLKRHLRIHTGEKPYVCDICHARFTQSNSLKSHRLIHTGDKPVFYCDLCPATCGRKTDLRIHVQKLHTAEKPLKCKKCGKVFPDRYSFKLHCKSHDGEKCWKCDLCPYASSSQRHLESHSLIHTDQKPYLCEHCDQSFRQKQLLKRHVNLYHNPLYIPPPPKDKTHKCPECKKAFRHKGNLLRHMTLHDPDSDLHEQQVALKIGRQKKVHIIDGHKVEVIPDDEEETEDESAGEEGLNRGSIMSSGSGPQYVVLEVISVAGEDGTQQNVAVVPAESLLDMGVTLTQEQEEEMTQDQQSFQQRVEIEEQDEDDEAEEDETNMEEIDADEVLISETDETRIFKVKQENDEGPQSPSMNNCFGFDEDDEDGEGEMKQDVDLDESMILTD